MSNKSANLFIERVVGQENNSDLKTEEISKIMKIWYFYLLIL